LTRFSSKACIAVMALVSAALMKAELRAVSVCEILTQRGKLNGSEVRLFGTLLGSTYSGWYVADPRGECPALRWYENWPARILLMASKEYGLVLEKHTFQNVTVRGTIRVPKGNLILRFGAMTIMNRSELFGTGAALQEPLIEKDRARGSTGGGHAGNAEQIR
jgi:hypothetical protein